MTSSTHLPADVFLPAPPPRKIPPTSSIMQFQLIYYLYSLLFSPAIVIFLSPFQFENIFILVISAENGSIVLVPATRAHCPKKNDSFVPLALVPKINSRKR